MELKLIFTLIRRWAWLLILGGILGGGAGYLLTAYQTPEYQSTTKVMVMQAPDSGVSNVNNISDQELAQTYIQLLTTRPVLSETSSIVGQNVSARQVSAQQVRGTRLLEVTVRDSDANRAALIANTLVDVLISQNDTLQSNRFISSEQSLEAQVSQIEQQIAALQADVDQRSEASLETEQQQVEQQKTQLEEQIFLLQGEIANLEQEIDALTPRPAQSGFPAPALVGPQKEQMKVLQADLLRKQFALDLAQQTYLELVLPSRSSAATTPEQDRQNQQQSSLALYQQIYAALLSNYEAVRLARLQNTPNVVQVEKATASTIPVTPRPLTNILVGVALGMVAAGTLAFMIEYLDDTLKTPSDIASVLGLPVVGYVAASSDLEESGELPFVARNPRSPVAEAFRSLRTNLEFASVDRPLRTILVTSPGPSEGKTTIATNLAAVMAQGSKRVILVDGDLRRPRVHRAMGMSNHVGLSELFRSQSSVRDVARYSKISNLAVITSGSLPPNPAELLGSERMNHILERLEESATAVVIDSPPFIVADASVLAAKVDGVVLVVQPGRTHAEQAQAILEQLNRAGARVVGVVLNRIPRQRSDYYGGYRYYHYDTKHGYSYEGAADKKRESAKGLGRLFRRQPPVGSGAGD